METEEDDSSKHEKPLSLYVDDNLDVNCDTHRELQSNEQHCVSKTIPETEEPPPNISVESLQQHDAIAGDESLAADTYSKTEEDVVEETEIAEEKAFPNIVEDTEEDSVKMKIEPDMVVAAFSEQRVFADVPEDTEAEEKAVADFSEDKVLYEMVLADVAGNQVHSSNLVANFPEQTIEDGAATVGREEAIEAACLTNKTDGETLAETALSVQDAEVSNAINLAEMTEVAENAYDPVVANEIEVPKQDAFATEDKDIGVPVHLSENAEFSVSLVDETAMEEGDKTNLADETGEVVKMENVGSNTAEVGLTDLVGEIAEAVAEDKTVEVDGTSVTVSDRTAEVVTMENLAEETADVKGMDMTDEKIENVEDMDAEVQGIGVADENDKARKIGSTADEPAEVKGMEVTDYTAEVVNMEKVADRIALVDEIYTAEETTEADKMVYFVGETIGSEDTDANMTPMVEETEAADEVEEMDVVEEVDEASRGSSGAKRKRGKNSRAPARVPSRKKVEEDVCFICFDGGDLVLCDRRGCPKAYHPSCINRDDAFFRSKGRWNCGWHLCSNCEKSAHYMCYTCTFSLCKGCLKNAVILCVRGNKGFCETCMKFVMLIEKNEHGNMEKGQIDFNDKSSWEYLFKEYWTDLKGRLSLTFDELVQAKNPWKGSETLSSRPDSPGELYDDGNVDGGSDLEISENEESGNSKKRKAKKRSKSHAKEMSSPSMSIVTGPQGLSTDDNVEWASKELLEFVMHMRNGDKAFLSQFDVQALLLEYIKRNKLRDPRRKSQIICDSRLENLFGKPRVGHFEMLKLLESHFIIKEDSQTNDLQGSIADTESSQLEADGHPDALAKTRKEKKRKTRKKGDERGFQSNLDDYAAIDIHNINLIYLRRNLVEDLIEDEESFQDKVIGSFVRIRISGSAQKQDLYRLVRVVGTSKASEPYKIGKRMTDILLEILNLNKTEVISIDIISNQEFTEDECKRLRQSMKCGILNRLTVGDLQEKAMSLQDVRVKDWMETEIVRLSHLRDRASEKGRRKELRECVEKLQLLKMPEERQRRLEEIPEIHTDPNMDPSHESDDEDETDDKRQEIYTLPRGTSFGRRTREPVSPGKGGSNLNDSWSGMRNFPSMNRDMSRNLSAKSFSNQGDDAIGSGEIINENSWSEGRDRDVQKSNKWEKQQVYPSSEIVARNALSGVASELSSAAHSPNAAAPPSVGTAQHAAKVNESEKIWRYQDPSGKVQGPFSIVQLRKWSNTGYFPADLRIWRASDKQEDSLLLTDVLAGKILKDSSLVDNNFQRSEVAHTQRPSSFVGKPHGATLQLGMDGQDIGASNPHTNPISFGQSAGGRWKTQTEVSSTGRPSSASIGVPKYVGDRWSSDYGNSNFTNLPSPTPSPGGRKEQPSQAAASFLEARTLSGGNGSLQPSSFTSDNSMQGFENDSLRSHSGLNTVAKTDKGMVLGPIAALQIHPRPVASEPILDDASVNPTADIKSISANLQSLVQSISSRNPPVETQGHGPGSVLKREINTSGSMLGHESQAGWDNAQSLKVEPSTPSSMPAQPPHSRWGEMSPAQNVASSFSAGNPTGNFSTPGFSGFPPSDLWRSPPPIPSNQPHVQSSTSPNIPWGIGAPESQSTVPRPGLESQNQGWGPMPAGNPNIGWGATAPPNTNMVWGAAAQGSAPPNVNPGWIAPGQGPPTGNAIQGWAAHGPVPPPVNANSGWVASNQGPPPPPPGNMNMNMNASWPVPSGNQGMWGNEHGKNRDRFSNQRDGGSHGGDSGSGGKSWGMQSSIGGGGSSSRPPYKGQRVCKYHENGHCKKGASCDYMHN